MSFLQPWMLWALPIIALPIIIHLINQFRYRTIEWGAMQFLLTANRMSRGYARIRQWLILAARTLAIAGLLFAVARPLASGWLSLASGGRVDTTIILLDRSPSMQQQGLAGGGSKLESARRQLIESLSVLPSNHWVLIDSVNNKPIDIESPEQLESLTQTEPVSASADVPAMLQTAHEYIRANRPSRTEVWICSDVRRHDWDSDSGRWQAIRDSFLEYPQPVRFHLLAYADVAEQNRAIRVTDVRRVESDDTAQLLLSMRIEQAVPADGVVEIPVRLEIDGALTEVTVELTGGSAELEEHAVPLDVERKRGWGRVSIPADANPADNEFFFVFDQPTIRRTIVVAEEPAAATPLQLAAAITPDPNLTAAVEAITPDQVVSVEWNDVSLVLWQAPLPAPENAGPLQSFIERGGQVVFFPPATPTDDSFAGVRWQDWQELPQEAPVASWIGDQDLLANVRSGAALPVGQLKVSRYCELDGEYTALATLEGGAPLLCRVLAEPRNVYFCATTPAPQNSSLARDGVVFYVMIQRAVNAGAASLGATQQLIAGQVTEASIDTWRRLSESSGLAASVAVQSGVYQHEDRLFAINRSLEEDVPTIVPEARVAELFKNLPFDRIDEQAGSGNRLLEEIWRIFLGLMIVALILEAILCIPRRAAGAQAQSLPGTTADKLAPAKGAAA